ncbi:hypothetical protein DP033_05090 [Escherichia coli]|nr:hypothetical protein [Escherichia coli]
MLFMSCAFAVFDYTIKNVTVSKKKMTPESKLIMYGSYKSHLMSGAFYQTWKTGRIFKGDPSAG